MYIAIILKNIRFLFFATTSVWHFEFSLMLPSPYGGRGGAIAKFIFHRKQPRDVPEPQGS
jgi:hypothetical protein